MIVLVVLAILVVGNFLRDGKSNYLEGGLCVLIYLIIAVTTWYYPQVEAAGEAGHGAEGTAEMAAHRF